MNNCTNVYKIDTQTLAYVSIADTQSIQYYRIVMYLFATHKEVIL